MVIISVCQSIDFITHMQNDEILRLVDGRKILQSLLCHREVIININGHWAAVVMMVHLIIYASFNVPVEGQYPLINFIIRFSGSAKML